MSSGEMPPSSSQWRYLTSASTKFSSFKDQYLSSSSSIGNIKSSRISSSSGSSRNSLKSSQEGVVPEVLEGERQSWRAWAGQKIGLRRGTSDGNSKAGSEALNLFPGWAVRRYRKIGSSELDESFEVEVYISGFAISHRSAETASRSQRAFIRLAKGFASLPKITADALEPEAERAPEPLQELTPSTEELLAQKKLPPRPTEITEDYELDALERQFLRASSTYTTPPPSTASSRSSSVDSINQPRNNPRPIPQRAQRDEHEYVPRNPVTSLPADALRKLHANLETRLQPFWSSVLAARTIRLNIFAAPHKSDTNRSAPQDDEDAVGYGPVAAQDVVTSADGSFQARFVVKWEELCQHPGALHIAFGDKFVEHGLLVSAQILPALPSPSSSTSDFESFRQPPPDTVVSPPKSINISITHSPLRVISDIDDTVKLSGVLNGARAVFHNVFVKELQENIIPGMGEWYTSMWSKGVRFHYVSNGPFELLPVINDFFQISQLPPGSIRLKSYAGRSIFNGLLSAPALRKRAGVMEILDSFPESRFFLIGDSGEQDLELYAELARDRPNQILAVFVRDVETGDPIDDPTGWKAIGAAGTRSNSKGPKGSMDDSSRPRRTLSDFLSGSSSSSKTSPAPTPRSITPISEHDANYFTSSPITTEPEPMRTMSAPLVSPAVSMLPNANREPTSSAGLALRSAGASSENSDVRSKSPVSFVSMSSQLARLPEAEKKRYALQMRVYVARTQMPGHIPLRVFRNPGECVEVEEIMDKEQDTNQGV